MADPKLDFEHLTVAERIQFARNLWDRESDHLRYALAGSIAPMSY